MRRLSGNRWDPRASAVDIVSVIWEVYSVAEVGSLRDLLIEKGARLREGGDDGEVVIGDMC